MENNTSAGNSDFVKGTIIATGSNGSYTIQTSIIRPFFIGVAPDSTSMSLFLAFSSDANIGIIVSSSNSSGGERIRGTISTSSITFSGGTMLNRFFGNSQEVGFVYF